MAKTKKFSVNHYLKKSERSEPLKQMMRELYHGKQKTLEEWKEVDKNINEGRVK